MESPLLAMCAPRLACLFGRRVINIISDMISFWRRDRGPPRRLEARAGQQTARPRLKKTARAPAQHADSALAHQLAGTPSSGPLPPSIRTQRRVRY